MQERYSRLMEFRFADFSKLKEKTLDVVGIGGLGAPVCDILARCGIGRLILFDFDKLEEANLNRTVFRPCQIGMYKVDAIAEYIKEVNPDVNVVTHTHDITGKGYRDFISTLDEVDAVLGCVDSFDVRMLMNAKCVAADIPLIDGGAGTDGITGSVHVIIPRKTPCYRCNKPAYVEQSDVEIPRTEPSTEKIDVKGKYGERVHGTCHFTSLPTTMTIIASLQCQETLKYLLNFGDVSPYILYDGMSGEMKRIDWEMDPRCPVCGR